jgi:MerR family redox-sensitive transcriptional activator SoxR
MTFLQLGFATSHPRMLKLKVSFKSSVFSWLSCGRLPGATLECGRLLPLSVGHDLVEHHGPSEKEGIMKIGQLAARANLRASAIRYYEKRGLLAAPQRIGGQRRYSSDALDRVLLIRFAGDMGFTLAETKLFLNGLRDNSLVGPRWKKLAARKLAEVEQNIARSRKLKSLLHGLQHCHCASLQQCVRALGLSENLRALSAPRM